MKEFTCKDCPFCYKGENDEYAHCHYESKGDWDLAPCEIDDDFDDEQ